jgi:hypothetical protein
MIIEDYIDKAMGDEIDEDEFPHDYDSLRDWVCKFLERYLELVGDN